MALRALSMGPPEANNPSRQLAGAIRWAWVALYVPDFLQPQMIVDKVEMHLIDRCDYQPWSECFWENLEAAELLQLMCHHPCSTTVSPLCSEGSSEHSKPSLFRQQPDLSSPTETNGTNLFPEYFAGSSTSW